MRGAMSHERTAFAELLLASFDLCHLCRPVPGRGWSWVMVGTLRVSVCRSVSIEKIRSVPFTN